MRVGGNCCGRGQNFRGTSVDSSTIYLTGIPSTCYKSVDCCCSYSPTKSVDGKVHLLVQLDFARVAALALICPSHATNANVLFSAFPNGGTVHTYLLLKSSVRLGKSDNKRNATIRVMSSESSERVIFLPHQKWDEHSFPHVDTHH